MANIPSDPIILYSFINTKLRDEYPSLQLLCDDLQIDRVALEQKLAEVGFEYDALTNSFK